MGSSSSQAAGEDPRSHGHPPEERLRWMVVISAAEKADELLGQLGYADWRGGARDEGGATGGRERVRDGRAKIGYGAPERFASGFFPEAIGRRKIDLLAVD